MKYRLAIFDLDGTVLNTLADLSDAVNAALTACDYPARTEEQVRDFIGDGIKKLIERAVPTDTAAENIARVYAAFVAHYTAHCADKTAPYAGIVTMLRTLRARGVKTAVLSNKADPATVALCNAYFAGLLMWLWGSARARVFPKSPHLMQCFPSWRNAVLLPRIPFISAILRLTSRPPPMRVLMLFRYRGAFARSIFF